MMFIYDTLTHVSDSSLNLRAYRWRIYSSVTVDSHYLEVEGTF